jgi:Reverse transcriptase (RNA-dependent DNA polymerase)
MCIDYKALNKATVKNDYPLPRIDEVWDQLGGSKYFSAMDLRSGYNQIRIAEEDVHETSFRTRFGSFESLVIPFGLSNAPPIFQSVMNDVLHEYLNGWCILYLDDILIHSHTPEEHLEHIELVFKKCANTSCMESSASVCSCARNWITWVMSSLERESVWTPL